MSEKNFVAYGDAESILTGYANRIKQSPTTFVGTQAQWNALSSSQKAEYELVDITDDSLSPSGHVDWESNGKLGAKNVCPVCVGTTTLNGVTFTVNSDGTISATGTATEFTAFDIATTDMGYVIEDGDYVLSDGLDVHSNNQYTTITIVDQNDVVHYDYANTKDADNDAFSIENSNIKKLYVAVCIGDGHTVSNLVFKPMIRLTTDSDETYQPYAMTNKQITPYVQAISNPNLLDNPWFTVNQRGQSNYIPSSSAIYSVDRWKLRATTKLDVLSNGIKITSLQSSGSTWFMYVFEDDIIVGKTVTVSIKMIDGTIFSDTLIVPTSGNTVNSETFTYNGVSFNFRFDWGTYLQLTVIIQTAGGELSIRAMKLELGSVSTLAMDTAPNYQQELAKCQRYFWRIYNPQTDKSSLGIAMARDTSVMTFVLQYRVAMRSSSPTISTSQDALWYTSTGASSAIKATGVSGSYSSYYSRNMNINGTGLTAGSVYQIYLDSYAYIEISADL